MTKWKIAIVTTTPRVTASTTGSISGEFQPSVVCTQLSPSASSAAAAQHTASFRQSATH